MREITTTQHSSKDEKRILVTGVTGYIGGRLVPHLLQQTQHKIRVMIRGEERRLADRPWVDEVEVVTADALRPETLTVALAGVDTAYYFIHSMRSGRQFHEQDRRAAQNFAEAAAAAGVEHIVYLSGLGDAAEDELSAHLRSRQETGEILGRAGVPVTRFRAAVVIGSGSASFELMRHLVERLPVLICPRWVYTRIQPIGLDDVLAYLTAALEHVPTKSRVIEIGGANVLSYAEMMRQYAAERGLKRYLVPVPLLTPKLSSYWAHLVTPIPASIAQPLIAGLRTEVVVKEDDAQRIFPAIQPEPYTQSLQKGLANLRRGAIETVWSDAISSSQAGLPETVFTSEQGMYIERRERLIAATPEAVYRAFAGIGGENRWPYHWLWRIRGGLDKLVGGVGLRRGRRHPNELRQGDALDFWRVEAIDPGHRLLLRAEMKVPGRAWLQFKVEEQEDGKTKLVQTAFFDAHGLFGLLYWYSLLPLHTLIFPRMIETIARRAERMTEKLDALTAEAD